MHTLLLSLLLVPPAAPGGYLVVLRSPDPGFADAAETLARARAGELVRWDGDWAALEELLRARKPRDLALVLPPDAIDANLPRRLAPILAGFDADPFLDCAYGLITGASGADARGFVENILRASGKDLPLRSCSAISVVVDTCMRVGPSREAAGIERALESNQLWLTGADPEWREFLARERGLTEDCGLVEWGHCGDSQGIWLFPMDRNLERAKHWPFDPARVGQDPSGEMPRLSVRDLLEGVELFPAVVVNGACHSAVTRRTMVGPDIVSTFGDTGGLIRFWDLPPEQSFPLMAIRAGATAYIGALAANNANRVSIEEWWIRRGGVALGEVVKRTHDELVLADPDGVLALDLFADGASEPAGTPMFEDCLSRVLFGDPAFVPWRTVVPTSHQVDVTPVDGGLDVTLRWSGLANDPWVWDPWRPDPTRDEKGRLYERIELAEPLAGEPVVSVREAFAWRGKTQAPLALDAFARLERDRDGRAVLHLKAQGPRAKMQVWGAPDTPDALEATFEVRTREPRSGG
jgi:hypothetical protein